MNSINDVYNFLNKLAPVGLKSDKDNVGLLVGRGNNCVSKIIVSLDITNDVISEAINEGSELIVSHHPMFYSLINITDTDAKGRILLRLIENGIAAICMHTNLDIAQGGVNDELAKIAGIEHPKPLSQSGKTKEGEFSCGRFGNIEAPTSMSSYLGMLKNALNASCLRYYDANRDVYKVAVAGGSGGADFSCVLENGCDTFLTADIKYNLFLECKELGINLIDGGHFHTENVIIPPLAGKLREHFSELTVLVSKEHKHIISFY